MKIATSLDGRINDGGTVRRVFSSAEDILAVQDLRSRFDAILVGAETVRKDNPQLCLPERCSLEREAAGLRPELTKVTLTRSGDLSPDADFFCCGSGEKIVFTGKDTLLHPGIIEKAAVIRSRKQDVQPSFMAGELWNRGIRSLLVEGGAGVAALFLTKGLVDRLRIAVAPCIVSTGAAKRWLETVNLPALSFSLAAVYTLGGTAVLEYERTV